ncbi:ABC transporter B family member 11-like [Dendrobium catenatum]|uniref:ABC transporter B family member 11-like n=1 Tax=Dendrobium catenatum TaxID=906689 RepID=UPI0009F54162|nr:ABC transporter B family member 11-like [Dendrobium catenatum]
MIVGTAGAVATGATMPLAAVIMGNMTHAFGADTDISHVIHDVSEVCLQYVYLAIWAVVASFLQLACWMITGERQATRIRKLYLNALLNQEIAFFDNQISTGEVVERMSGDTILIQDAMGEKVGKYIQLTSKFFIGFTVAFIKGWLLTLVMISTIPPILLCNAFMSKITIKIASSGQKANTEASIIIQQTVSSIRTVASFTGENVSVNKFEKALENAYRSTIYEGIVVGLSNGMALILSYSALALGFWYGAKLILDKSYTGGEIISVIFAVIFASNSIEEATRCMTSFAEGQVAAHRIFQIINRKPKINASDIAGTKLDVIHGDIEFKDVYFSYPSRPKDNILTGLSIFIHGGTTVALIGESGSGKSTIISLIERFYDPQDGEVLIDGINIKKFHLRWLRQKIGLVSQEPILFASSIRDNISYGKNDATIEEIKVATQLANASRFINMLPQGLDTMVGEHGTQLSGGQKQRIAIARAILKDPRILLLDEATSALDVESEQVVQEALDRVMTNRTTVIIAHRLTTVRNSDSIIVMNQGSILEKGSHSELIKDQNSAYSQLTQTQLIEESIDKDGVHYQAIGDNNKTAGEIGVYQHQPLKSPLSIKSSFEPSSHSLIYVGPTLPERDDLQERAPGKSKADFHLKQSKKVPLRRLAYLNKEEIPILLAGSMAAIINGLKSPMRALMTSTFITIFYSSPDKIKRDSIIWSATYLAFGVANLVAIPIRSYLFAVAGASLIRRVRLMAFKKVVNMEIAWFDDTENSSGAIGSKLSSDAATLKSIVGDSLALLVQNTTTLIGGLTLALLASWQLSLIVLALLPFISLKGCIRMNSRKGFSADAKMMYEEANQVANDALRNIRTVASFSAEEKIMELYNKRCKAPISAGIKHGSTSGLTFAVSFPLTFCINAAIFYAGARLINNGSITFGQVYQVFYAVLMTTNEVSISRSYQPDLNKAKYVAASIFTALDRKSKIDPSNDSGLTLEMIKGNIEFQHVSFKYPTRPDVEVFRDICLSIQSGKVIAFVGESGSGKSTAIALLQRFYDPTSGHILLDETDIQKFQLRWLRQQMGLVSQEPILFDDTIHANIAYGKEGRANETEIIAAAELANAHKFISSLNQGYQTVVGERGIQLSGGQKQRVAIARAIVKQPKILLLDEATSALDMESERIVQDALNHVMVNRTTLVIAHRLATINNADHIAVIKDGVIVEQGKHETLVNINNGVYASMIALNSTISS